jgi:hypothetical protein
VELHVGSLGKNIMCVHVRVKVDPTALAYARMWLEELFLKQSYDFSIDDISKPSEVALYQRLDEFSSTSFSLPEKGIVLID